MTIQKRDLRHTPRDADQCEHCRGPLDVVGFLTGQCGKCTRRHHREAIGAGKCRFCTRDKVGNPLFEVTR